MSRAATATPTSSSPRWLISGRAWCTMTRLRTVWRCWTRPAVAGDEVDDVCAVEEIFCQLFSACEHARDVRRAEEWIRVGEAVATRRRLPAVSAFCRTHYGAVLTAAGRWPEADAALTEAVRLWGLGHRSALRRGAIVRL